MKKYVITGGLGVGKSTTVEAIEAKKHTVVYEISNMLVDEHQSVHGKESYPWENGKRDEFQEICVATQLDVERIVQSEIVFYDRCIIDEIPFYLDDCREVPEKLWGLGRTHRYAKIFYIEALPIKLYQRANHRPYDREKSDRIERFLLRTLRDLKYEPIVVPVMTPERRARYILERI